MSRSFQTAVVAAAIVVVLAAGVGFVIGSRSSAPVLRTGVASPAENAISVEADGWTYNVPLDVPWTDAQGAFHDKGRPACLPAGANVPIRFASVDVSAGGTEWRQIVWVDCRVS